jgi:hypothetical protein
MGLPYPSSTSPANVPGDIYNLANTLDGNVSGYITTGSGASTPTPGSHIGYIWWCSDTANTTNFGLNYSDGTTWHNIGTDFVVSGTTPTAKAINQIWFNTNNGTISYWNGSAWTQFYVNASYIGSYAVANTSPATNQALIWNGSSWGPAKVPTAGIATGALPSGVTLPATQVSAGTLPSGVLLPVSQLTSPVISEFAIGTQLAGSTYAGQQLLFQSGTATVNTNSNAQASITFPSSFSNGLIQIIVQNRVGSGQPTILYSVYPVDGSYSVNGFTASFWVTTTGNAPTYRPNQTNLIFSYTAIGF